MLVLGYQLWRDRLGADESIVGQPLVVGGQTFAVIGIAPPGFSGIKPSDQNDGPQIWIPLRYASSWVNPYRSVRSADVDVRSADLQVGEAGEDRPWLDVVGRRRESASLDDVRRGFVVAASRRSGERPDIRAHAEYPARRHGFGPEGTSWDLLLLMAMMLSVPLTVLAIACANVANLQLARATARTRELAVRQALGASRGQVVRLLSCEAALLAVAAAAAGWAGAAIAIRYSQSIFPLIVSLDWRVLGFAVVLVGFVTMISGVAPAWIATRRTAAADLQYSARVGGVPHARVRHALVVVQIAASFVLLAGSQLFVRMASTVRAETPNSIREQLIVSFDTGMVRYGPAETARVMDALEARLRTRPDVKAVTFDREGRAQFSASASADPDTLRSTGIKEVTPAFAAVTSARVLSGRWLEAHDSPRAVVVNERLARQLADDGNVVGRQIVLWNAGTPGRSAGASAPPNQTALVADPLDIVGIIESQRRRADDINPAPLVYRLLPAAKPAQFDLHVRTTDAAALAGDLRGLLRDVDPRLPWTELWLGADLYGSDFVFMRVLALAVGGFGALALVVAAAGLHAVMTYIVSLRRREFGIRLAIGARAGDLISIVGRAAVRLLTAGLVVGLLIAIPLAFVFRALLVGVELDLLDPWAWTPVILALGAVTMLAAIVPARRAARVNPVEVLRAE